MSSKKFEKIERAVKVSNALCRILQGKEVDRNCRSKIDSLMLREQHLHTLLTSRTQNTTSFVKTEIPGISNYNEFEYNRNKFNSFEQRTPQFKNINNNSIYSTSSLPTIKREDYGRDAPFQGSNDRNSSSG